MKEGFSKTIDLTFEKIANGWLITNGSSRTYVEGDEGLKDYIFKNSFKTVQNWSGKKKMSIKTVELKD